MRIMGVDTSTKTGYAILAGDELVKAGVISHKPRDDRFERYAAYGLSMMGLVEQYEIELVVIEGYSFGSRFNHQIQYELGAIMRHSLWEAGKLFVEVPPTSLKKFVTGKGNAKKDLMLLGVYKRWDFDTEDDNEADAYGLAQFGRAMIGMDTGVPQVNLSAVEKLLESNQPVCKQLRG